MITNYIQQYNSTKDRQEKNKVSTPATADSQVIQQLSSQVYEEQSSRCVDKFQEEKRGLFKILQEKFMEKVKEKQELETNKCSIWPIEENIQKCGLKVMINILNGQKDKIKTFKKDIIKTIQKSKQAILIFDNQHQKLKIQADQKYILEVFLQTSMDSYRKKIWEQNIQVCDLFKKWSVITIQNQDRQKDSLSLNVQIQKMGKFYLKPLSVNIPFSIIEQFFDFKHKLLNKSELLSTLTSISQLKGLLFPLSKQNMGSRIIQKLLGKAKQIQIDCVIDQLIGNYKQMIFDRYGNYVFQKIFKMSNHQQRTIWLSKVQSFLIQILTTKEGTHCIQALIDDLNSQEIQHWFLKHLSKQQVIVLSKNKFSLHFISKILGVCPKNQITIILIQNFKQLASDKQGIVVLKSLMRNCLEFETTRYNFLSACQNSINQMAFTQYGHYVIQQMLLYYNHQELICILNYVVIYIGQFSQNQFSSSIVRKFIESYKDFISVPIIYTLLNNGLEQLMESPCGQFVLHRLMEFTQEQKAKKELMNKMMVSAQNVKSYEKRHKWMKYFKLI